MMRRRMIGLLGALVLCAATLVTGAFSLRSFGPDAGWNVFAQASAAPPTPIATSTPTATPTPTSKATATPAPPPTPTPPPAVAAPNPPAIPGPETPGERWIDIDLASPQSATAMIGEAPLYTALVTTGKDGWETPRGEFQILYRVADETMTSAAIGAEEYSVLDHVLYTQYFSNAGHAIHLNYWRDDWYFGNVRSSHGCAGMRLADAEFFWNFASLGTRVVIH